LSVVEALRHAGFQHGCSVEIEWISAEELLEPNRSQRLSNLDGVVIPGGFGERGVEGKIAAAEYCRVNAVPCLGLCLGMQVMTIEFARHVVGLERANSSEFDPFTPHPVIDIMEAQRGIRQKGGTMRLGAYPAALVEGSQVAELYGAEEVSERHRHRYEFNSAYKETMTEHGFLCSGTSPDGSLVEFIEVPDHPFWIGTQAHPEFTSRPTRPSPLFSGLVIAARDRADGRNPHLPNLESAAEANPSPAAPSTAGHS
jgi:CTP synthase